MARNAKYTIQTNNGNKEVNGTVVGEWWGVHKRDDKTYALTHLPSGMLVWSSRKKTTLQMLLQEPEFFETPDHQDPEWVKKISLTIKRFCDKNTDLNHKPKKKVGWE